MEVSPFPKSTSRSGHGEVHLALLPPSTPTFRTLRYTYPLKLIPSTPHKLSELETSQGASNVEGVSNGEGVDAYASPLQPRPASVPLLFLLSYGGGLLPRDSITLDIKLDPRARLTIATQGSTKIFPSDDGKDSNSSSRVDESTDGAKASTNRRPTATQNLNVYLCSHSALLLSPDPSQPFAGSHFSQTQIFHLEQGASVGLLDWVVEGRRSRGERWHAGSWKGKNEIWRVPTRPTPSASIITCSSPFSSGSKQKTTAPPSDHNDSSNAYVLPDEEQRGAETGDSVGVEEVLLLRDFVILSGGPSGPGQATLRHEEIGVFGTLVLAGPLLEPLGAFFLEEFAALPRIGGRDWGDDADGQPHISPEEERRRAWRKSRLALEGSGALLWTAARVRGMVVTKFGARQLEDAKVWLNSMWRFEGSIAREFGEGGLMNVR